MTKAIELPLAQVRELSQINERGGARTSELSRAEPIADFLGAPSSQASLLFTSCMAVMGLVRWHRRVLRGKRKRELEVRRNRP